MSTDSKPFKAALNRLAERLTGPDGGAILAQLQTLGMIAGAATPAPAVKAGTNAPRVTSPAASTTPRIGVWDEHADAGGTSFIRSPKLHADWRYWAEVPVIPPKSEKKRIVYFGESAARGYFFDPALTPAQFLERSIKADTGCEVVDLARTDLRPKQLLELVRNAAALKPDALVVFAGNNWHYGGTLMPADMLVLADAVGQGAAALRDAFLRHHPRALARSVVQAIAAASRGLNAPAMLVIPAFNLGDWVDDAPLPLLPNEGNARWHKLRAEAEALSTAERYPALEAVACAMIALDQGVSPTSYTFLARAFAGQGRFAEARTAAQAACDAVCGLPCPSSPRCPAALLDGLRDAAREAGIATVDIPQLLAAAEPVPGKRWFMDYCHHSADGLALVVGAIAETLSRIVPGVHVREDRPRSYVVGRHESAMAHFLAAIHNSHFNQPEHILEYHCMRALEIDPGVAKAMKAFLSFRTAPGHDWLHASFKEFCDYASARRYAFKDAPHKNDKRLTYALYRAISRALWETPTGASGTPRRSPPTAADSKIDLLQPAHWLRSTWGHDENAAFVIAREPISEFWFLRDVPRAVVLRLCCRAPGSSGADRVVRVSANGVTIAEAKVSREWTVVSAEIPADAAAVKIAIAWPELVASYEAVFNRAQQQIECGAKPDVFPRYGEIFELSASPVPSAAAARQQSNVNAYVPAR